MPYLLLALVLMIFSLVVVGCAIPPPPEQDENLASATTTDTVLLISTPSFTQTAIQQASETPTMVLQRFDVSELVPSSRCEAIPDKRVITASWVNQDEFTYAYYPIVNREPSINENIGEKLQWTLHNTHTGEEALGLPNITFDHTFWERNHIEINAINPELAGYFSPSGKYAIYHLFYGESFEPTARNEIWVAEVHGKKKWKVYEESGNAVDIARAAWFDNETKVIFNIAYEGPREFYVSDFRLGKTDKLSEISQFAGFTEETWRLSPDGKTLAVVDWNRRLLLVSLDTGNVQEVEMYGGSFPQWSNDGRFLFYWWRANKDDWWGNIDEFRVYDLHHKEISTLLNQSELVAGFRDYQGDDNCLAHDYYLLGGSYAVSPDQKSILLWDNGLYLLTKR